jgi:DnaJ-domain-containing protein 1
MRYSADQLKRKLRQLKKLEMAIRFKDRPMTNTQKLIWDVFFSTRAKNDIPVKYPLSYLLKMSREELKAIVEEYFYRVYFQNFQENGLAADVYDPQLLALLGLPPHAGMLEIKQRYRELAKRYHPDHGGDSQKFIELVEIYERLKS